MRLYLPATIEILAALHSDGAMGVGDDVVVAVGGSEDEEYDALMTAAESAADSLPGSHRASGGGWWSWPRSRSPPCPRP